MKKKTLPPVYLFFAIILIILLHFLLPIKTILAFPRNLLGIVPFVVGIIINIIANNAFKKHKTTVKPFEETKALITGGIFQLTRNPMYLGFVFILFGIVMLIGSISPYIIVVVLMVVIQKNFISIEEKMLEKKFGKQWSEYKEKVRPWI